MTAATPRTAAGQALLTRFGYIHRAAVLDVEAQAVAAALDRLEETVRKNAGLICDCHDGNCPRLARFLTAIEAVA